MIKLIKAIYNNPSGLKVLDLGSGNGAFADILRRHNALVITADKSAPADVIVDLEEPLPFSDKEFDLVTALAVLEHLRNGELFIRESLRVGKTLIGTTPAPKAKPLLDFLSATGIINKEHIQDHKRYWSKETLESYSLTVIKFEFGLNYIFSNTKVNEKLFQR